MKFTKQDWQDGRARLQELLPAARAVASGMNIGRRSAIAQAQAAFLTEDNLDAVMIYPAPQGGWHADLLLKQTPPGIANTIGSPVERPYATRAAAEESAVGIVGFALASAADTNVERAAPAFLLHGFACTILPEVLGRLQATGCGESVSKAQAVALLEKVLGWHLPTAASVATLSSLPRTVQAQVALSMAFCMLTGVFAYPLRTDAPPRPAEAAA